MGTGGYGWSGRHGSCRERQIWMWVRNLAYILKWGEGGGRGVGWFRNEEGNIILFSTYADIGQNWAK